MEQLYQLYKTRDKDVLSGIGEDGWALMRNGIRENVKVKKAETENTKCKKPAYSAGFIA